MAQKVFAMVILLLAFASSQVISQTFKPVKRSIRPIGLT